MRELEQRRNGAPTKTRGGKLRSFAGFGLLSLVVLAMIGWELWPDPDPGPRPDPSTCSGPDIAVDGIIGGKIAFMQDPDVVRILKDKYCITDNTFRRVGSIEMIQKCGQPLDYCWPSSQTAGQEITDRLGSSSVRSEIIFNSPIVMYTWAPIADALIAQGIVEQSGETFYMNDFLKLIEMIEGDIRWADIGVPQLHGEVSISTSDPKKSNTGHSFAGLLANTLNGGQVVDEVSIEPLLPRIEAIFAEMGLLQSTTTQLFEQFLSLGMGAAPIVVAYESNLIEYALANTDPATQQFLRDNIRTLYPRPTVWSSQPLIALTPNGEQMMTALRDPEIQRIGWERHGFRPAVPTVRIDLTKVNTPGIPQSIDSVIQMPNPATMRRIIEVT
jgi:hypothetical protein